ncbi:hypothetical protein SPRG_07154 [Saprolegnia parasitica CBS 223.65]|uniref:Glycosyl hydrolase family 13 catalytic domain-containing protein n=1 Tax=Saprolegnia parasitica (strain CBS 223.65) TaxID=695850 RepID=A0A067CM31_SAPPC|nr:hypothetical protein SPRG_07154 [Saprolegnia parasitica CBS 223.65]KDO27882.1 hypothetical protein SPRG_07154 [Saprolegnia parasitica CBS 223.65]|eukprot:XP_012201339.1 hypothetical protein SPRG_07154 [Saprolegnia parasitica CBS 223.65]
MRGASIVLAAAVASALGANPVIYEISTRPWLYELSLKYNRPMSLDDPSALALIQKELLALKAAYNPDYIWMMGVWQLGAYGLNLDQTTKNDEFNSILPGWTKDDVIGSPYAVANYTCNPSIGTDDDLRALKSFLNANKMKLMLDFVPNHVAVDHPWACSQPEFLLPLDQADLGSHSCAKGPTVRPPCSARSFYTGGDYWNSGWVDTVQLNYWNPALRSAQIDTLSHIASLADGIRCDMAMSVLNREIELAWVKDNRNGNSCSTGSQGRMPTKFASSPPTTEFWADAIPVLKAKYPSLFLMAENYNYGFTPTPEDLYLQSLGFDVTYDMDALKTIDAMPIGSGKANFVNLVRASSTKYAKSVHFVENHDDNRAAGTLFNYKASAARAAALAVTSLPGSKLFFHGQFDCNPNRLAVQLRRGVSFKPDAYCQTWFADLLQTLTDDVHTRGNWLGIDSAPFSSTDGSDVISYKWQYNCTERLVVANYRDAWSNVRIPLAFPKIADKNTLVTVSERLLEQRSLSDPEHFDSQVYDYSICPASAATPATTTATPATTTVPVKTPAACTSPVTDGRNRTAAAWKERSVYQILTDRFAGAPSSGACKDLSTYCGGTFNGIKNNLQYIRGMGFDAIWISPVIDNSPGGYHGYWARDWDKINAHFGTPAELQALVDAAHALDMWVMVDVVTNHVAPVGSDFRSIVPFNDPAHYHPSCEITDWNNQTMVETCRLSGLPDLDQSNAFVRSYLLKWIKKLVADYGFDGVRVDTVPEVAKDFWAEFNTAAGVFQVGEVFNGDPKYVGSYQPSVSSVFNYPMSFTIGDVFGAGQSMKAIKSRVDGNSNYADPTILGSFVDNHDNPRFMHKYPNKQAQLRAATVFSLTTEGIPFVYYGTEQYYGGGVDPANREALWTNLDTTSDLYKILSVVHRQRKKSQIWLSPWVERYAADNFYSFSRGAFLVALTNSNAQQHVKVTYHPFKDGDIVCNIFWPKDDCQTVAGGVDIYLNNGESKIYVLKSMLA